MLPRPLLPLSAIFLLLLLTSLISAHTVITYPGWRGDNLLSNGTVEDTDGLVTGTARNDTEGGLVHPYGMQWEYPCGGMPTSQNRTKWPVGGGALAIQPGWFSGHATAFFYINLGFGEQPANMSFNMIPAFQITGPSRNNYPGTFCLPQVPLPANTTVNAGDLATIQVIETALHGAALYNCVDIEFADPADVAEVNNENCFNSTNLSFQLVFSTDALSAASSLTSALPSSTSHLLALLVPTVVVAVVGLVRFY